jgi:transposase
MHYQHSLEIHERLQAVLQLIETGRYSTPGLAKEIGVSVPTISRIVAALRERGHDIRAEKQAKGWRYVLIGKMQGAKSSKNMPIVQPTG